MKYIDRILIIVFLISLLIAIKTQEANPIVYTIAIGFCVSYIFYLLVEFIPRKLRIYRAKKILSPKIHQFLYELFVMISQILYVFDIDKKIEDIEEKDLLHINGDTSKKFKGKYDTGEYYNVLLGKETRFSGLGNMNFEFPKSTIDALAKIPISVEDIMKTYPLYYNDEVLAEVLSSLHTSDIVRLYSKREIPLFLYAHSAKDLFPLIADYKKLKSLMYHTKYRNTYHTIEILTEEEAKERHGKKDENVIYPFSIIKPIIIFDSKYKDARSIITELNDGWLVSKDGTQSKMYETLESTHMNDFVDNKCVVILQEDVPQKQINAFIKENKNDKIIIRLIPNYFFTTRRNKFEQTNTSFGVYKLYYRKPLHFLGITFFSKHPMRDEIYQLSGAIYDIQKNCFPKLREQC